MDTTKRWSSEIAVVMFLVVLTASGGLASADDLTGATRFVSVPVQATLCIEDGECAVDLPWNVNIPQFIEVDLEAKRLATTEASGQVEQQNQQAQQAATEQVENFKKAFSVCLEAKKYMVKY